MNTKRKILGLAVAVLGLAIIFVTRSHHQPQFISAPQQTPTVAQAPTLETVPTPQPQLQPTPEPKTTAKTRVQNQAPVQNNNLNPGKESLQDPDAREALTLVGFDPNAEQYWLNAIFDTSLSDNERGDLMEDLNETGFDDPKNLTADDLPLIASRLAIINAVLPGADDFMTQHLLEARKDLVNMFGQVTAQQ